MAEPEELEEDLFADLYAPRQICSLRLSRLTIRSHSYDADESTNRATSAVETAKPTEPATSAIPAEPSGDAPIQSYEDSHVDTYPAQAPPQMDYGMGYQNGHDGASATPVPAAADNDNHGTGIKEDG